MNLLLIMNRCPFVSAAPRKPVSFSKLNAPWQLLNNAFSSAQFRTCLRLGSSLEVFANLSNILSLLNPPFYCLWFSLLANLVICQCSTFFVCPSVLSILWKFLKKTKPWLLSLSVKICFRVSITWIILFYIPLLVSSVIENDSIYYVLPHLCILLIFVCWEMRTIYSVLWNGESPSERHIQVITTKNKDLRVCCTNKVWGCSCSGRLCKACTFRASFL